MTYRNHVAKIGDDMPRTDTLTKTKAMASPKKIRGQVAGGYGALMEENKAARVQDNKQQEHTKEEEEKVDPQSEDPQHTLRQMVAQGHLNADQLEYNKTENVATHSFLQHD